MRSKWIIDITTKILPDGGASVHCRMNHSAPADSAKTAVAKAMLALNDYCDRQELGIFLVAHDKATQEPLFLKFKDKSDS